MRLEALAFSEHWPVIASVTLPKECATREWLAKRRSYRMTGRTPCSNADEIRYVGLTMD